MKHALCLLFSGIILIGIFLIACNNNAVSEETESDSAYLRINTSVSRTVLPNFELESMTDFLLTGKRTLRHTVETLASFETYGQLTSAQISITSGQWYLFTLTAKEENTVFRAEIHFVTITDGENDLMFELSVDTSATEVRTGTLSVSFILPFSESAEDTVCSARAGLFDCSDGLPLSDFGLKELSLQASNETVCTTYLVTDVPSGNYRLQAYFYADTEARTLIATHTETVIITDGNISEAIRSITDLNSCFDLNLELNGGQYSADYAPPDKWSRLVPLPTVTEVVKGGYTLDGWYTNSDLSGEPVTDFSTKEPDGTTLYAKWIPGRAVFAKELSDLTADDLKSDEYGMEYTLRLLGKWGADEIKSFGRLLYQLANSRLITLDMSELLPKYQNIYINSETFSGCTSLVGIFLPATLSSIGSDAFNGCISLSKVLFVGSIAQWCKISFSAANSNPCWYGAELYVDGSLVTDLIIPDDITALSKYSFYNCSSLTTVNTGNGVLTIGDLAFYGCSSLSSVVIGDTVTQIGPRTFENCSSLKDVVIGSNVKNLGWGSFRSCRLLQSLSFPDSLESIQNYMCVGCKSLTDVVIGTGTKKIETYAFSGCSSLSSIVIPDNVTEIGDDAFADCTSLKTASIGDCVENIGWRAFYRCTSLEQVVLGSHIANIESDVFEYCSALKSVEYTGTVVQWCGINFSDEGANPCAYGASLTIGGSLVQNLVIPDNVRTLRQYAFYGCTSLKSVNTGEYVTSVDKEAFEKCTSLETVIIGNNVASIGKDAFYSCTSLVSVIIGSKVTEIGDEAFSRCASLTQVTIGAAVTTIGNSAFCSCSSLTSVKIPVSVTDIGNKAFSSCSLLATITFTGTKSQWTSISKGSDWNYRIKATKVTCSNGTVTL